MPLLPNLADLKNLTNSINPLNFFTADPVPSPSSTPVSPTNTSTVPPPQRAEPGPGPSTADSRRRLSGSPSTRTPLEAPLPSPIKSSLRPQRPTLLNIETSSTSSLENGLPGRRKSSGASVIILDPEGDEKRKTRADGTVSGRSKRKAAMDTYIIVKPPPTTSKNPLNLQIQLVVKPRGRDRSASIVTSRRSQSRASGITLPEPVTQVQDNPNPELSTESSGTVGAEEPIGRSPSPTPVTTSDGNADSASSAGGLVRASSRKSSKSSASAISARSSSGASTTSGNAGKRIEPMFNLAVHNVMQPTVVTDASTDVKVAKFHKRHIDVAGVGLLEPSEVWLHPTALNPSRSNSHSDDGHSPPHGGRTSRPMSMISFNHPLSPALSRSEEGTPTKVSFRNSLDLKADIRNFRDNLLGNGLNGSSPGSEPGAKKFFGKLFKRKGQADSAATSPEKLSGTRSPTKVSTDMPSPSLDNSAFPTHAKSPGTAVDHMGHPTFGTAPLVVRRRGSGAETVVSPDGAVTGLTAAYQSGLNNQSGLPGDGIPNGVSSLSMIPSTRPIGYTWTVRKWAKRNTEGWAAHIFAANAAGLDAKVVNVSSPDDDEVVFEWVKMKSSSGVCGPALSRITTTNTTSSNNQLFPPGLPRTRSSTRSGLLDTPLSNRTSPSHSRTSLILPSAHTETIGTLAALSPKTSPGTSPTMDSRPAAVRRLSGGISPHRASTPSTVNTRDDASIATTTTARDAETNTIITDADSTDSDPEDSETPWTCSIWIKSTNHRQLLGTLTPAPHHPKVIGVLKIPVGLQAVPLAVCSGLEPSTTATTINGEANAHSQGKSRGATAAKRVREEVCISEEGLKDVVCVSAMWLVAREEFGGLGRKKKV